MKTKTIFKALAFAMLMPAMMLTTACSNSDDEIINTENPANTKGYALPVTINVTRQGDDATTRATFDGSKLSFSTGDKLFVRGYYNDGDYTFAGILDYVSDGTFSGTIITQTEWTGTIEGLLGDAKATLLPAGYGEYGYLSIADGGTYKAYLIENYNKAFATSKTTAVEQFSYEWANSYSNGFALSPQNAIVSFTISGLTENTEVAVLFSDDEDATPVNVTTDASGVATFASAMYNYANFDYYTLTVDGNAITLPADKEVEAGHIYNISRSVAPAPTARALAEATTDDIGKIAGADGNIYDSKDAAEAAGTTAVAMITYVGSDNGESAPYNHGLALALNDETSTMAWQAAIDACSAKNTSTPVTNATWLLPSQNQWRVMFKPIWNTEYEYYANSYSDLNTNITTAGGTALQEDAIYWSSSEDASKQEPEDLLNEGVLFAYYVWVWDDDATIDLSDFKTNDWYFVRAVLAF